MATLLVLTAITGSQVGSRHTLSERVSTIGSASSNTIVLRDRMVEPRHAEVHQMLDRWFVVPLIPGQGVSLNGIPINGRSRLNLNDTLTLGTTTYRVAFVEAQEQEVGGSSRGEVPRLGTYLVRRGAMTNDDVKRTADRQNELRRTGNNLAFGQVAYQLGFINRSQLDAALAEQRNDFNERFRD